jgi:hypothetical protein
MPTKMSSLNLPDSSDSDCDDLLPVVLGKDAPDPKVVNECVALAHDDAVDDRVEDAVDEAVSNNDDADESSDESEQEPPPKKKPKRSKAVPKIGRTKGIKVSDTRAHVLMAVYVLLMAQIMNFYLSNSIIYFLSRSLQNYSLYDRYYLLKAYLAASETKKGADRKSSHFWNEVQSTYSYLVMKGLATNPSMEGNVFPRTTDQLRKHFGSKLQPQLNKFCGLMKKLPLPSGSNKKKWYPQLADQYNRRATWTVSYGKCLLFSFHDFIDGEYIDIPLVALSHPKWKSFSTEQIAPKASTGTAKATKKKNKIACNSKKTMATRPPGVKAEIAKSLSKKAASKTVDLSYSSDSDKEKQNNIIDLSNDDEFFKTMKTGICASQNMLVQQAQQQAQQQVQDHKLRQQTNLLAAMKQFSTMNDNDKGLFWPIVQNMFNLPESGLVATALLAEEKQNSFVTPRPVQGTTYYSPAATINGLPPATLHYGFSAGVVGCGAEISPQSPDK